MVEDIESNAELAEVPASEILDKIKKGKSIDYDHVRITGAIDLSKLNLPIARAEYYRGILKSHAECNIVSSSIKITNSEIDATINFSCCLFEKDINFMGSTFRAKSSFESAIFRTASFREAIFISTEFREAIFGANFKEASFLRADFNETTFNAYADFRRASFLIADFKQANFLIADFRGTNFSNTDFDDAIFNREASFQKTAFSGKAYFNGTKFEGDFLTFRDATFYLAESQEDACRRAKNVLAKAGNRDEEEYHFYREMEAKRIQKGIRGDSGLGLGDCLLTETWSFWRFFLHDIIEYIFVQKIFGYGVHPYWLFGWWFAIVVAFAIIYWIKGGIEEPEAKQWFDYLWFSIATAATPGYALYKPMGLFKFITGIEAILGTFMWAAFITTFARKFSR